MCACSQAASAIMEGAKRKGAELLPNRAAKRHNSVGKVEFSGALNFFGSFRADSVLRDVADEDLPMTAESTSSSDAGPSNAVPSVVKVEPASEQPEEPQSSAAQAAPPFFSSSAASASGNHPNVVAFWLFMPSTASSPASAAPPAAPPALATSLFQQRGYTYKPAESGRQHQFGCASSMLVCRGRARVQQWFVASATIDEGQTKTTETAAAACADCVYRLSDTSSGRCVSGLPCFRFVKYVRAYAERRRKLPFLLVPLKDGSLASLCLDDINTMSLNNLQHCWAKRLEFLVCRVYSSSY